MQTHWAEENLHVIRTLMERSMMYRRALAPMMLLTGVLGSIAAGFGWFKDFSEPRAFVTYWLVVAVVTLVADYLLVRRAAFKEQEAFWSPPTRRVTQAWIPPLLAGCVFSSGVFFGADATNAAVWRLLPLWVVFYGCGMNAAGFFMQRGIKLFGWLFVLSGITLLFCHSFLQPTPPPLREAHLYMGIFFGGLHLAYGIYLYFTENRKQPA